jgi:hypothetical protein
MAAVTHRAMDDRPSALHAIICDTNDESSRNSLWHLPNSRHRIGECDTHFPSVYPPAGNPTRAKVRLGRFTVLPAPRLPIVLQVNPTQVEPARAASPNSHTDINNFRDLTHPSSFVAHPASTHARISPGFLNGDSIPKPTPCSFFFASSPSAIALPFFTSNSMFYCQFVLEHMTQALARAPSWCICFLLQGSAPPYLNLIAVHLSQGFLVLGYIRISSYPHFSVR